MPHSLQKLWFDALKLPILYSILRCASVIIELHHPASLRRKVTGSDARLSSPLATLPTLASDIVFIYQARPDWYSHSERWSRVSLQTPYLTYHQWFSCLPRCLRISSGWNTARLTGTLTHLDARLNHYIGAPMKAIQWGTSAKGSTRTYRNVHSLR
jgi:hypothetical protein